MTKEEKKAILKAFKMIDVKRLELDHADPEIVKWFRFGSFTALQIASEIVKSMPEEKKETP